MSTCIVILKKMNEFSSIEVLNTVKKAVIKANMYCLFIRVCTEAGNGFEGFDGTLSEEDEIKFQGNYENGVYIRNCVFNILQPDEDSYDSFTWLVNDKNYFRAFVLKYLDMEYEFAFRFLVQYFSLEENKEDYLWFDDAEWYYTAEDIINLGKKPYNPEWVAKKLS